MNNRRFANVLSFLIVAIILVGSLPVSAFDDTADYSFVQVDIKSQATGIIYMDSTTEGNSLGNNNYAAIDLIDSNGATSSTREAIITSDRTKLSSVAFDETTVPFDIAPKRAVSSDLTDKEAIMVKDASNNVQIDIPDGYYGDLYFVAFTAAKDDASAQINLNYSDSEATLTQPIYGYNKTYTELSNAVLAASGTRLEMPLWLSSYYTYTSTTAKYYVYKIPADNTKLLKSFNITATNNATAILGVTGSLDVSTTRSYVEELLLSGNDVIVDNLEELAELVNTLVLSGIERDTIQGIANLDNVRIPVGKSFVNVDVKKQANGLIYMDSVPDSHLYSTGDFGNNDFLPLDGATSTTWEAMITADTFKISSVDFDDETVPFKYPAKRKGTDINDKEAIVLKAKGAENQCTLDVPDGCYEDIYFVALSTVNSGGTPTTDIELKYRDGSTEVATQTMYSLSQKNDSLESAVYAAQGQRVEMITWTEANDNYTLTSHYYAYKVETDPTKLLTDINLTVTDCASAFLAVTGHMDGDATIEYLESELVNLDFMTTDDIIKLNEVMELLKSIGVDVTKIAGSDEFYQIFSELFYVTGYEFSSDLGKWFADIRFSQAPSKYSFDENISVYKGDTLLTSDMYDTELLYEDGEVVGMCVSGYHNLDYKERYTIDIATGLVSEGGKEFASEWNASYVPEQIMGISSFAVTKNEDIIIASLQLKPGSDSEDNSYAVIVGMYDENNKLIDYFLKSDIVGSEDIPLEIDFVSPGIGKYEFRAILVDSYSLLGLMDVMHTVSLKIE